MSPELRKALGEIFSMYSDEAGDSTEDENIKGALTLTSTMAARLWYRCGMKLANLDSILEAKTDDQDATVTLEDFLGVIEKVVEDDEAKVAKEPPSDSVPDSLFEVRRIALQVLGIRLFLF